MSQAAPPVKHRLRHRLEAGLAHVVFGLLRHLPFATVSAFGAGLGRFFGPLTGAHRTGARNLALALPEYDEAARAKIIGDAWDNFGRTMMEYAVLPQLAAKPDHIIVEGNEALAALAREGRAAVLFCAHLANWEIIPMALARLAKPMTIVYRAPNNPLVDEIIGEIRKPYTAGMAPKSATGARLMLRALANNEHLILVVDQKINTGMEIPFFGRGAYTGDAVARFAMRFDCPVFPVRTERLEDGRMKVTVEEPWTFPANGTDDDVRAALMRINRRLEEWIRARPGQWLWMHKRWPK
jgi:Kdo2-lipid IVA lauroyltransferase/acyltransferase